MNGYWNKLMIFYLVLYLSLVLSNHNYVLKKLMYKTIPNIYIFLNMPKTNAKTEYIWKSIAELIQFECGFLSENSKVMSPKFFYAFVKLCQKCPVLLCIAFLDPDSNPDCFQNLVIC